MQGINIGERVSVSYKGCGTLKKITGRVVYMNKNFFTIQVEKYGESLYKESFMYKEKLEIHKH